MMQNRSFIKLLALFSDQNQSNKGASMHYYTFVKSEYESTKLMDAQPDENDFLRKIEVTIKENIANENFGVAELAERIGMSRSNLLRKVKKEADLSVSQFIRKLRLEHAKELLQQGKLNVSEISYEVGFSSVSYFIKCFHDQYGVSPGELNKQEPEQVAEEKEDANEEIEANASLASKSKPIILLALVFLLIVVAVRFWPSERKPVDKSIAVLPFINDSSDSTNVYIINGLMESLLNNFQKISDLRVISRTSVEKYRHQQKSIPEIAKELNVAYFVEGSGQKIGNRILLNIQLIEAETDKHLWARQYRRELTDIFDLQRELANDITSEIKVIVKPKEKEQIEKAPTDNVVAYDYFLKGLDMMRMAGCDDLRAAITWFEKALAQDSAFAQAYAHIAISYYYLDRLQAEKIHLKQLTDFADKALFYDPQLSQALMAKALSYMAANENRKAEPYLEKAHKLTPNSAWVINMLSDFYAHSLPNASKYLEYALRGVELDIASHDSTSTSYIYLHVSNAFMQNGLTKEAKYYIDLSLAYNPQNIFSDYLKAYIEYAEHLDLSRTRSELTQIWEKDTTRLDVLQEIAKTCYQDRDYDAAFAYYKKFVDARDFLKLDIYRGENAKIGWVFSKVGKEEEAEIFFTDYKLYAENNTTVYKQLCLASYHSLRNNKEKAIYHLKQYVEQDDFPFWIVLFFEDDPLFENCSEMPEFKTIIQKMKQQFQERNKKLRIRLKEKGLLDG